MVDAAPRLTLTQRKRQDILAAARAEFLDNGFRDTSMDRVAERAQVSKRTVYNHFPSKEALFSAIAGQFVAEMQQAVYLEYDPQRPLDEQLREIALNGFRYAFLPYERRQQLLADAIRDMPLPPSSLTPAW